MKINSNNLNKMIQSAFSKEIIFSYFPLDIKLKVFNISKHYQSLFKLSILDYEVFRSFKLTFPKKVDISKYYQCFFLKYPTYPKERLKRILDYYISSKKYKTIPEVNVDCKDIFEILNEIGTEITLNINSILFLDNELLDLHNYSNIIQINIEFPYIIHINVGKMNSLFMRIIHRNIKSLTFKNVVLIDNLYSIFYDYLSQITNLEEIKLPIAFLEMEDNNICKNSFRNIEKLTIFCGLCKQNSTSMIKKMISTNFSKLKHIIFISNYPITYNFVNVILSSKLTKIESITVQQLLFKNLNEKRVNKSQKIFKNFQKLKNLSINFSLNDSSWDIDQHKQYQILNIKTIRLIFSSFVDCLEISTTLKILKVDLSIINKEEELKTIFTLLNKITSLSVLSLTLHSMRNKELISCFTKHVNHHLKIPNLSYLKISCNCEINCDSVFNNMNNITTLKLLFKVIDENELKEIQVSTPKKKLKKITLMNTYINSDAINNFLNETTESITFSNCFFETVSFISFLDKLSNISFLRKIKLNNINFLETDGELIRDIICNFIDKLQYCHFLQKMCLKLTEFDCQLINKLCSYFDKLPMLREVETLPCGMISTATRLILHKYSTKINSYEGC